MAEFFAISTFLLVAGLGFGVCILTEKLDALTSEIRELRKVEIPDIMKAGLRKAETPAMVPEIPDIIKAGLRQPEPIEADDCNLCRRPIERRCRLCRQPVVVGEKVPSFCVEDVPH